MLLWRTHYLAVDTLKLLAIFFSGQREAMIASGLKKGEKCMSPWEEVVSPEIFASESGEHLYLSLLLSLYIQYVLSYHLSQPMRGGG